VQFGAGIALLYENDFGWPLGLIKLEGGASFDALLKFKPEFYFECRISFYLSLSRNGQNIIYVGLEAGLSGPNQFHIWGKAAIKFLCFEFSVDFEARFGDKKPEPSLPTTDAGALLIDEVKREENWSVSNPTQSSTLVSYRCDEDVQNYLNVNGGLDFAQNLLPLKYSVEKLGETEIANKGRSFDLNPKINDAQIHAKDVTGSFAPAMYRNMTDAEKISSLPFVKLKAGFSVTAERMRLSDGAVATDIIYDVITASVAPGGSAPGGSAPAPAQAQAQQSKAPGGKGRDGPTPAAEETDVIRSIRPTDQAANRLLKCAGQSARSRAANRAMNRALKPIKAFSLRD
jgi:hypothetical protein